MVKEKKIKIVSDYNPFLKIDAKSKGIKDSVNQHKNGLVKKILVGVPILALLGLGISFLKKCETGKGVLPDYKPIPTYLSTAQPTTIPTAKPTTIPTARPTMIPTSVPIKDFSQLDDLSYLRFIIINEDGNSKKNLSNEDRVKTSLKRKAIDYLVKNNIPIIAANYNKDYSCNENDFQNSSLRPRAIHSLNHLCAPLDESCWSLYTDFLREGVTKIVLMGIQTEKGINIGRVAQNFNELGIDTFLSEDLITNYSPIKIYSSLEKEGKFFHNSAEMIKSILEN